MPSDDMQKRCFFKKNILILLPRLFTAREFDNPDSFFTFVGHLIKKRRAMQGRMKQHQLTAGEIEQLLTDEAVGRLATINPDGSPYVVPVHFVYHNGEIYIHGLIRGQKIANIAADSRVCFEVDRMQGLVMADRPCDVNTAYQSVVVTGTASLISGEEDKRRILELIVKKYAPGLSGGEMPSRMVDGTSVIGIGIRECTGKYYR